MGLNFRKHLYIFLIVGWNSLQLRRSSILTFADFEYHFFLRECLAGASFSLAAIENGKPGISLAILSDLPVFFHPLRGDRKKTSCMLHCAFLMFIEGKTANQPGNASPDAFFSHRRLPLWWLASASASLGSSGAAGAAA